MVGDNPRADRFFHSLATNGKSQPARGPASGKGPSSYTVDGPTKALYDAQFLLINDLNMAWRQGEFAPSIVAQETWFSTVEAMQEWVDDFLRWNWSHVRAAPTEPVKVVLHDPHTFSYRSATILAPRERPRAWRAIFLVHEMAHHFGERDGHGLTFVRTMIEFVAHAYDQRTADRFTHHLTDLGVQT